MSRTQLTAAAKSHLSSTIRDLHATLLADLHASVEGTYRMSLPLEKAGLEEGRRVRRARLEAWIDERARALPEKERAAAKARFRLEAEKEAAYTFLHRVVMLRQLEQFELSKPAVVKGGWTSSGYTQFREFAPGLLDDGTDGFATLLSLLFEELAHDLPGLFGDVGIRRLIEVPAKTLRTVVEKLNDPALDSAWGDDTTLGWVYQYWNDPDREAIDDRIADGKKVEPHEIASKTQMFTERYMVEWLLQNSLGTTWLAMCRKHGWVADAEGVLPELDARRAEWRVKREAGEVPLDALMPLDDDGLEGRWKYYVPQPLPEAVVEKAPASITELKLLDPACGSGHFLVIAFDLLVALYREEARHRGASWDDAFIATSILENNLHGLDIDPRPIQLAAAGLYLKAKVFCPGARPSRVNLVAASLRLGDLPSDDPALVTLRNEIQQATGIPQSLTNRIVEGLKGADHLGTLLKVDEAIDEAIRDQERAVELSRKPSQGDLITRAFAPQQQTLNVDTRRSVLDRLEEFLEKHSGEDDLGLRLDGEQLAAGIRFIRLVKEGAYDVVVGNPPYQGTSKMKDARYVGAKYPDAKADLYAAFLERGLQLVKPGGVSAMVTMRGWMFLTQFTRLREKLLQQQDLRILGDVDRGAFDEVPNEVLAAAMSVFRRQPPSPHPSVAMQPTPLSDKSYDRQRTNRKRAAVLAQVGRFEFEVERLGAVAGWPVIYWWSQGYRENYRSSPKLGDIAPVRQGLATADDTRFIRKPFEVGFVVADAAVMHDSPWVPFIKGGRGRAWVDPISETVNWSNRGLALRCFPRAVIRNPEYFFRNGVAYSAIGNEFIARAHRGPSVFGHMGPSVFTENVAEVLCAMNSAQARECLQSLNPGVHFEVGDVIRLPVQKIPKAETIYEFIRSSFTTHEAAREASIEFRAPGPSPWRYAQDWAQRAVDRAAGEPLPPYEPEYDPPRPLDFVSFAVGVALGRFGANGEGILDTAPAEALPHGILFLSSASDEDSLAHPACRVLHDAWAEHGEGGDLRAFLRTAFFRHHKEVYENRPIYLPLSSERKSFVAWCSIHRWNESPGGSLQALLADHLHPELRRLEGHLSDARTERASASGRARTDADKRVAELQRLFEELTRFIDSVTELFEKGPPPAAASTPPRERDHVHRMDLDDGVMVNAAALWPVLDPQWDAPKKWWKELAQAKGRKDYDWSHLARLYFPERVEKKAQAEPSMAVAHGVFWKYHPATAYRWELRLQDEIGPEFRLDEEGSDEARAAFERDFPVEAAKLKAEEEKRRSRKQRKDTPELFERDEEPDHESEDGEDEDAA